MALMTCRTAIATTIILSAVATAGCAATSASAPPAVSSTSATVDDDATAGLLEHHRFHHHGGVTLFIALSLDTLGVSPERRVAVEKIRADLHARMEPARAAEQTLTVALADGLAAPTFDTARVDAAIAQVNAAAATVHDASADALNELHRVLSPAERAALVDKVEAHWAVWQKANAEAMGPVPVDGGHLATLTTDLSLTPDQVSKIRAALGEGMKSVPNFDRDEIATRLHAFDDAFRSEKFDAHTFNTAGSADAHLAGWGAAHMAHFIETVSPQLTADQRTQLTQRLREHATHDPNAKVSP